MRVSCKQLSSIRSLIDSSKNGQRKSVRDLDRLCQRGLHDADPDLVHTLNIEVWCGVCLY